MGRSSLLQNYVYTSAHNISRQTDRLIKAQVQREPGAKLLVGSRSCTACLAAGSSRCQTPDVVLLSWGVLLGAVQDPRVGVLVHSSLQGLQPCFDHWGGKRGETLVSTGSVAGKSHPESNGFEIVKIRLPRIQTIFIHLSGKMNPFLYKWIKETQSHPKSNPLPSLTVITVSKADINFKPSKFRYLSAKWKLIFICSPPSGRGT